MTKPDQPKVFATTFCILAIACAAAGCAAAGSGGTTSSIGAGEGGGGHDALETNGPSSSASVSSSASTSNASSGMASSSASGGASTAAASSSTGGGDGSNCSIMSSNQSCSDCLEASCCKVVHACIDADLLGCTECLDCFLSGNGAACCDESVGKNGWLEECVAFNCEQECG